MELDIKSIEVPNDIITIDGNDVVGSTLEFVREYLGMDVAYISEINGGEILLHRVSAPGLEDRFMAGDRIPIDQAYSRHIKAGRLTKFIPDTAFESSLRNTALTQGVHIGSYVNIPIQRLDVSLYGMFCCFSTRPRTGFKQQDRDLIRTYAGMLSHIINSKSSETPRAIEIEKKIYDIIERQKYSVHYQPIVEAETLCVKGFEALCRFEDMPNESPSTLFLEAARTKLQIELEICVMNKALIALRELPNHIYVSVNASPTVVQSGRLQKVFAEWPKHRIVLELTEHEAASDPEALLKEIKRLKRDGVRLAIDDCGSGHSGLQQIVRLTPDFLKLDKSLTCSIDTDFVKRSLVSAMVQFSTKTNMKVVVEGVQTQGEFETLKSLQVELMQGYFLGRPMELVNAVALCVMGPLKHPSS